MEPLKGREAAAFLLGYCAAKGKAWKRLPKAVREASWIAGEVMEGGTFRGPLAVWDMEKVANEVFRQAVSNFHENEATK